MGNLFSLRTTKKNNKYGSSRRIYVYPIYNKYLSNDLSEHLTKLTLTQTKSDPTAIGKFNQKPNTPFENKRKSLPTPKIKSQHLNITAIELNKLKNDINTLRQLLRIETDQKTALIEQVKKQQLEMLNNIKYYQILNIELQNQINKLNKPTKSTISVEYKNKIKDLKEQLEIIQTKLQIKLNEIRNNTYNNMLNLKQLELLRNRERILVLENKQLSYIIKKINIIDSVPNIKGAILCQDTKGKLFYVSDSKCPPDMIDPIKKVESFSYFRNIFLSKNNISKIAKLEERNKELKNQIKHYLHIDKTILCPDCYNINPNTNTNINTNTNTKCKLCDRCSIINHCRNKFSKIIEIIGIVGIIGGTYPDGYYDIKKYPEHFTIDKISQSNSIIFLLILIILVYSFIRQKN